MKQCVACKGLVPDSLSRCPNCALSARGVKVAHFAAGAGLVALLAAACGPAPMPAYGVACTGKQVDGGNNGCPGACDTALSDGGKPSRDPGNTCFNDAGIP